jgi:hypothetical protein
MRSLLLVSTALLLACAGLPSTSTSPPAGPADPAAADPTAPVPPTDPQLAWVDGAVAEALYWEVMPGTSGDEDDGTRAAELRTFFLAHPEYADAARRELLAREACGLDGTEAAHAWVSSPPARTPLVVDVQSEAWELFVAYADQNCTSDDWSWFTNEANLAAAARGATTAYADPRHDAVIVNLNGREVVRIPLEGTGYLGARAGVDPQELGYTPASELPDFDAYFGPPAPGEPPAAPSP